MQRMQRTDKWKKIANVYIAYSEHDDSFHSWEFKICRVCRIIARKNMKFPTFCIVEMYFSFVACFEGQTRMERPTCCVKRGMYISII